ncbi:sarcosine oxidase [Legionella wadsworthii]|uniref:Sarcosine oxidase n=1 Tax=Legionella wadsworthii TaxID=28088 RepID=A0A378LT71_9GAMM|nr:FAD-dependent oxidoreductase [Legionella wadsworthii]STY30370.1 sarcosine oxidase [Legionella wadsworthii]
MVSLWRDITKIKHKYPSLDSDLEVDVVIIGGGITGITAAKQLIDAGKTVALIDAQEIGGVTTGASTGNLYVPVQPLFQSIESNFDFNTAKTVAHSRQMAIDYIESTVHEYNIKCHFKKRPWYAYTNKADNDSYQKEIELWKRMELAVDETQNLPLNLKFKKAVVMANQARFNPLQYVTSLAHELHKKGCHIFEHTRALKINEDNLCTVNTEKAKIKAQKVIIATHTPIGINPTQLYLAPYRSYVVAVSLKNKEYPEGHFRNMDDSAPILCTHPHTGNDPELLMVAGSHHKTGQGTDMNNHFRELSHYLEHEFDVEDIVFQWSAQHFHAADSIPYIGLAHSSSKHVYMATGYFADGLVYGTLAGIILGDLLSSKMNQFFKIYDAQRKDLLDSSAFLFKENGNVLLQYLKDLPLFTPNEYQDLKAGEGKIVEVNRIKYAVSKNEKNELHVVTAVCPHMKGIVSWNNAEQTWDCPLHGSRFSPNGEVIEGPATCSLKEQSIKILDKDA